jgi:membrane-associated phospholipid phosphatase
MVALFAIIPFYLFIGHALIPGRAVHVPEVALDRVVPMEPAWSLVYLSLFLAALLPVFVVHQQELVRRTILAFLAIWLVSYACFIAYPTAAPRHDKVIVDSFFAWTLQAIYSSDIRYNCLPSLHVAQCFLAALICYRVHRGVGAVAGVWAFLVGLSTLYTKQHYILDVIAGAILASGAYLAILRDYRRESIPELERRLAPLLALGCRRSIWAHRRYHVACVREWCRHMKQLGCFTHRWPQSLHSSRVPRSDLKVRDGQ